MGKGQGKLGIALKNAKLIENTEKQRSKPVAKKAEVESESEGEEEAAPKLTTKEIKALKKAKQEAEDDYKPETLSKKEQRKLKKLLKQEVSDDEDEDEDENNDGQAYDLDRLAESASEDELSGDEAEEAEDKESEFDIKDDDDVPLSDVEIDSDADIVPYTKLTINNTSALKESLARIELPWAKHSFQEHQSIVSSVNAEASIKDIYDDTERELAFYKQGLEAVSEGRAKLLKLKVAFSRPMDYFAEMVKSDEHMEKLKTKLLQEAADKKASEEAKKQRHLKKFGKQVQNQTLQDRAKAKKETLDSIKSLKRKRQSNDITTDDFAVALEEATADVEERKDRNRKPNGKRLAKNAKYGSGGQKRFKRKNDADSSADVRDFSSKKMKSGPSKRPGKSRRKH